MTFLTHKDDGEGSNEHLSPYKSSPVWVIESFFIDIYFLLAHRIKGLGWSLSDFWACDTWTTSKLYCMELDVIEEEDRLMNESEDDLKDSSEMRDLYEEMYG